ncbi:MAG: L-threonylcarbamoyladenylate synthase [Burkholderiaceae bacterium]
MRLDGHDPAAVERAAAALAAGELVAFPTETVYGLGARADDDAAVAQIFARKGRPSEHPLIVHVAEAADALAFTEVMPPIAHRLMDAFWPGPLTVIVPRADAIARAAAGGQSSVGLRCPAHPVAQALLRAARKLGVPGVAAPSANRFGRISPTQADHVASEFGPDLWLLDGGACEVGIESSIVDCTRGRAALLRPGVLTRERIEAAAGVRLDAPDPQAPRASGTLESHYAPHATLRLMATPMLRTALELLGELPPELAVYSRTVRPRVIGPRYRPMPDKPRQAAFDLFATLRELDADGVRLIWVEEPPPGPEWDGVRDRLQRAAAR